MIVVAGHLCLDVTPRLTGGGTISPGALVEVGPASFSAGGAVANVGLALAKLGFEATLVGLTGDDQFGQVLREHLGAYAKAGKLAVELSIAATGSTSYSIVIDPPHQDRSFLHHPGCNDEFGAEHLLAARWRDAEVLHFGYPPLMRRIHGDGGAALAAELARLRRSGVIVSLDMAMPDPGGASGRVDWRAFLGAVLPHVDLFLPSWDEAWSMLSPGEAPVAPTPARMATLAAELLGRGPAAIGLKLGERGLYLRTAEEGRTASVGRGGLPPGWAGRELLSPAMEVSVRGTTGAGDATIAGLLAAVAVGLDPVRAATMATAVGACSVEGDGAVGGILSWERTKARVDAGWPRHLGPHGGELEAPGWHLDAGTGVMLGPADGGG